MTFFYLPASGQVLAASQLQQNTGFAPTADPGVLAANGIYIVVPATNPCAPNLYFAEASYTVVGNQAIQSWSCVPLPLSAAKGNGEQEVKQTANSTEATIVAESGLSTDLLTAVTGQDVVDRPARYQAILTEMATVSDNLDSNLAAIDSATSVDEINNIVNKPTGILFTGRGSGLGPEDLNVSYYTAFNSVSMTESETELYVPGTATVIAYGSGGPNAFDSAGNCFLPGDYEVQIRQASTGLVIATFECPLSPAGVDVPF